MAFFCRMLCNTQRFMQGFNVEYGLFNSNFGEILKSVVYYRIVEKSLYFVQKIQKIWFFIKKNVNFC